MNSLELAERWMRHIKRDGRSVVEQIELRLAADVQKPAPLHIRMLDQRPDEVHFVRQQILARGNDTESADPLAKLLNVERSEEHTSELQSPDHLVCRLLLEKKNSTPHARL